MGRLKVGPVQRKGQEFSFEHTKFELPVECSRRAAKLAGENKVRCSLMKPIKK